MINIDNIKEILSRFWHRDEANWQVRSSDLKWILFRGTRSQCQAFVNDYLDDGFVEIVTPQGDLIEVDPHLVIVRSQ